jgi:hypothetical protein
LESRLTAAFLLYLHARFTSTGWKTSYKIVPFDSLFLQDQKVSYDTKMIGSYKKVRTIQRSGHLII